MKFARIQRRDRHARGLGRIRHRRLLLGPAVAPAAAARPGPPEAAQERPRFGWPNRHRTKVRARLKYPGRRTSQSRSIAEFGYNALRFLHTVGRARRNPYFES